MVTDHETDVEKEEENGCSKTLLFGGEKGWCSGNWQLISNVVFVVVWLKDLCGREECKTGFVVPDVV